MPKNSRDFMCKLHKYRIIIYKFNVILFKIALTNVFKWCNIYNVIISNYYALKNFHLEEHNEKEDFVSRSRNASRTLMPVYGIVLMRGTW